MSVEVDFDKPRLLKYDLAAIRDLEQALGGKPIGSIVNDLANLGVNAFVLALWAGLKHEDRSVTPHIVTKRLETYLHGGRKLRLLADAINDGLEESGIFRAAADDDENPPTERPAESEAGRSNSGSSGRNRSGSASSGSSPTSSGG